MIKRSKYLIVALLVVTLRANSYSQQTSDSRFGSRQGVAIPVTITNADGEHVSGLNASRFSLSEGGQDLALVSAVEVAPVLVGKNKKKVIFVVLDAVGSSFKVQDEERKECLQLLADSLISETPVSLSEIDKDGLHTVHELTTRNTTLAAALLQLDNERSFLAGRDKLQALVDATEDASLVVAETNHLRQFRRGSVDRASMMITFLAQLQAFQDMARALQHANGRKAVLWLTGYFPIEINDTEDSLNIESYGIRSTFPVKSATFDYQKTIDLLNDAQISLFPVQLEGSQRTTIGLRQIARSTGGQETVSSDTVENLVKRTEDQLGNYYLLRFLPEVTKRDTHWKSLRVQLNEKSLTVKSPNGRFVFGPSN